MQTYDADFDHVGDFVERWNSGLRRARGWTIALAVLLIVVGMGSLVAPLSLYALMQGFVSAALLVGGIGQVVSYARTPELFRSPTALVMGVLNALLGIMLLTLPTYLTAETLALLLAALFLASGAERVAIARRMRAAGIEGAGVSLATGIVNIVAGAAFLVLPFLSSLMLVYLMAGYLVVGGASLLVEGIAMHKVER